MLFLFAGYNATVLAYGQTGSGKTYTMGGAYGMSIDGIEEMTGIIPRVIRDLYIGMQERAEEFEFVVKISYLEVTTCQLFCENHKLLFHYSSLLLCSQLAVLLISVALVFFTLTSYHTF